MSRNGSGTMSVKNTFSPGDTISASTTNANNNDFADELTNSVAVDGQSTMTGQLKLANGTAAAPAVTFGSDTDNGLYRIGSNQIGGAAGGSQVFTFDSSGLFNEGETVSAKSADYTAVYDDRNKLFVLTGNQTLSLTAAATLKDKWRCYIRNDGTGDWTIDPNSTETIDGETTKTIHPGESGEIRCDGTGFYTVGFAKHDFFDNYLTGLTLSNNATDATNDIDIAVGVAADSTNAVLMRLASSITKQLDAAWAVGTNAGGHDTGTVTNGTYHLWLIRRSDTGVVDVLFSTSATAPALPANYDQKRRLGSILREGGSIVAFKQLGDKFLRKTSPVDIDGTIGTTAATQTLAVPVGIQVDAIIRGSLTNASSGFGVLVTSFDETDQTPSGSAVHNFRGNSGDISAGEIVVRTNTTANIRLRSSVASTSAIFSTAGWIDRRGRDVV